MSALDELEARDRGALVLALVVQFLNGLGYGLIFPVAAFSAASYGLEPAAITALVALHPVVRLFAGPMWGALSDRWGRRPVLLAGTAVTAVGHLCFGLAAGPLGLAVARALTGLGSGDAVAATAVVADLTPAHTRPRALGMVRAAQGVGMLSGPVFGGLLGFGGLSWPGFAAAAASVLCFAVVALKMKETRRGAAGGSVTPAVAAWRDRGLRAPLAIAVAAAASIALAESIVPLAVADVLVPTLRLPGWLGPGDAALALTVGVILAWGMVTAVMDGVVAGRLVEARGDRAMLAVGLLFWGLAFAATPPVYQMGVLPGALAIALTAIPASLTGTALLSLLSRVAGPERQGVVLGAATGAAAVGEALGPLGSGWLYEWWYGLPYVTAACLLLGAAAVAASGVREAD